MFNLSTGVHTFFIYNMFIIPQAESQLIIHVDFFLLTIGRLKNESVFMSSLDNCGHADYGNSVNVFHMRVAVKTDRNLVAQDCGVCVQAGWTPIL